MQRESRPALFCGSCLAWSAAAQDKRLALTVELGDVSLTRTPFVLAADTMRASSPSSTTRAISTARTGLPPH